MGFEDEPSLAWRASSAATIGLVGSLSKAFMYGLNTFEVHGLDGFVSLLESRRDWRTRSRGLITVSNHISVMDDPLIWGVLPISHLFAPTSMRWTLGSHDICFRNKLFSTFFSLGQVLPTHRLRHSSFGGPFQPTMTQAVRLLSDPFSSARSFLPKEELNNPFRSMGHSFLSSTSSDFADPFSSAHLTYSTNGADSFPAPSAYASNRHSWIHIFPEGFVHQHPHKTMRYFKWGVARLILEADECPDIVPMWIEGNDRLLPEDRPFPRFLPRFGKRVGVWFGENVGGRNEGPFQELRRRWRALAAKHPLPSSSSFSSSSPDPDRHPDEEAHWWAGLGILSDELKFGEEAIKLREDCTLAIRGEILRLRRSRGYPDEDPKEGRVDTWREEGPRREGRMEDGSLVKEA